MPPTVAVSRKPCTEHDITVIGGGPMCDRTRRYEVRKLVVLMVLAHVAASLTALAQPAAASPGSRTTAIVSLGDSYISGEAGRWNGNAGNFFASRNGTDRSYRSTWYGWTYRTGDVYLGASLGNGCHRSDVAEIMTASIAVAEKINLACSGAATKNIFRSSSGGTAHRGEAPQADQLLAVAQQKDVKLVVLSIGGNDLGFGDIISQCVTAWVTSPASRPTLCRSSQQTAVDERMPAARANVARAIEEIRAVMSTAGYSRTQYRLVVQSYPSPVPRGSEMRYGESGWSRLDTGGCPLWDSDATWARDSLVPQIADMIGAVTTASGAQFLDLRDALAGREVCARTAALVGSSGPSDSRSEWARFLVSGVTQGDLEESFHPNAYAQRALGTCLTLVYAKPADTHWSCRNTPGAGVAAMTLAQVSGGSTG